MSAPEPAKAEPVGIAITLIMVAVIGAIGVLSYGVAALLRAFS